MYDEQPTIKKGSFMVTECLKIESLIRKMTQFVRTIT